MNQKKSSLRSQLAVLGVMGGSVLSGLAIAPPAQAQVNPCPRIFYEAPFNTTVPAPAGCTPNAFEQIAPQTQPRPLPQVQPQTQPPVSPAPSPSVMQPPLPGERQEPITTISMMGQTVEVRLMNMTAADVIYEVVVDTDQRILTGDGQVTLQNLSAPFTLTLFREDGGLLNVMPQPTGEPGVLVLSLEETTDLGADRSTVTVQPSGEVFVN